MWNAGLKIDKITQKIFLFDKDIMEKWNTANYETNDIFYRKQNHYVDGYRIFSFPFHYIIHSEITIYQYIQYAHWTFCYRLCWWCMMRNWYFHCEQWTYHFRYFHCSNSIRNENAGYIHRIYMYICISVNYVYFICNRLPIPVH